MNQQPNKRPSRTLEELLAESERLKAEADAIRRKVDAIWSKSAEPAPDSKRTKDQQA